MTVYFHTALAFEAEPLIKLYKMKCEVSEGPFRIYRGENAVLTVSGVGDMCASAALGYLFGKYPPGDGDIFVNYGTAGTNGGAFCPGDLTVVRKIGREGQRELFCDLLFDADLENVKFAEIPSDIAEMEAYGAVFAAQKFFKTDRVFVLKVISDVAATTTQNGGKIDKAFAAEAVNNSAATVAAFVERARHFYAKNTNKPYDFTENELKMLEKAAENLKLSYQDTLILKNYFWKEKLLGREIDFVPEPTADRTQGEIVLKRTVSGK